MPRVAGGEITPDKSIVLGEVARKYNLYTKITGAQRINRKRQITPAILLRFVCSSPSSLAILFAGQNDGKNEI